jgi:DNA-binding XRE family transcriptional regulator
MTATEKEDRSQMEQARGELTREAFDRLVSQKLRMIRAEVNLTQDRMAEMIGISKKTLVQVEKERSTLGFTAASLVAVLFRHGEVVQGLFGDNVLQILDHVASQGTSRAWYKTMGGKVWWTEVERTKRFVVQRHVLTGYHRILDEEKYLHYYSLDRADVFRRLQELEKDEKGQVEG